jgi:hypothetical protein
MKFGLLKKLSLTILFVAMLVAGFSQTQAQSTITFTAVVSNVCSQASFSISTIFLFVGFFPTFVDTHVPNLTLLPGQTYSVNGSTSTTPTQLTITGSYNSSAFTASFTPFAFNTNYNNKDIAGACMNAIVKTTSDGVGKPSEKPVAEGQSVDQVLAALGAAGEMIKQDGSQSSPKLNNVADPMFLREIDAFSAQVIWVTSGAGTLRSVITWDNPSVDLDLIVIGTGGCFQLAPPGQLAEVCDRAPFAPVPGFVFAVIIINWSGANQAFVLSLSQ